jgi:TonB family protein
VKITAASHVDFVLPALRSLERWEFTPGMQGDLPVVSEIQGLVSFEEIVKSAGETLAANGLAAPDGSAPATRVMPAYVVDPVWPLDELLAGETGSAVVEFTVSESGAVNGVRVREASKPAFGLAAAAAIQCWGFERPLDKGHGTTVSLMQRYEFKPPAADAPESDAVARVAGAMKRGEIGSGKGLDAKLAPLYRVRPEYPEALRNQGSPAGRAEIECVVDREGRVRLPRIVSATHDEFGWAAATAVAQWVFAAPKRGGQPVDVKVHIPFDFTAPTQ